MDENEWNLLDPKALSVIRLTMSKFIAFNIKNKNTMASLMVALTSMYKQPSTTNKVNLIKKSFKLKILENGNLKQHLNEFNGIMNQNLVDIKFDDEIPTLLILG